MGRGLGRGLHHLAVGDEMGLSLVLIVLGLAAAGLGLSVRSSWLTILAPVGWAAFLAGVVRLMVPGFF